MLNKLSAIVAFVLFFFIFTPKVFADNQFDVATQAKYVVDQNGQTKVTQVTTITNKKDFVYTPRYTIMTGFTDIDNLTAYNNSESLISQIHRNAKGSSIDVTFNKKIIGVNKQNKFTFTYTTNQVAKQTKDGWEIVIPGFLEPDIFSSYKIQVVVPENFGSAVMITPVNIQKLGDSYVFEKKDFSKSGIYMQFKETEHGGTHLLVNFPKNAMFLFPVKGTIVISNSTAESIENQMLIVDSPFYDKPISYRIASVPAFGTTKVGIDAGSPPFLTIKPIKVTISFEGQSITNIIDIGFLPDYYLLAIGGVIILGSIIVAVSAVKTWSIYFQKRK